MEIILASQSPRRLFLLEAAGFIVDVRPSDIDETALVNETVQGMTHRLCQEKAFACDIQGKIDVPIVSADTLVAVDGQALGQPEDLNEAKKMINQLSGRKHQVHTTVCVRLNDIYKVETVTTQVVFRDISKEEINIYVKHNDILDKAGAYAIQGGASGFIQGIEGSLDNVIGLPVQTTIALIEEVKQKVQMLQEV
ncbi:MAG: Maf family protein [Ghiorsea sp.]